MTSARFCHLPEDDEPVAIAIGANGSEAGIAKAFARGDRSHRGVEGETGAMLVAGFLSEDQRCG